MNKRCHLGRLQWGYVFTPCLRERAALISDLSRDVPWCLSELIRVYLCWQVLCVIPCWWECDRGPGLWPFEQQPEAKLDFKGPHRLPLAPARIWSTNSCISSTSIRARAADWRFNFIFIHSHVYHLYHHHHHRQHHYHHLYLLWTGWILLSPAAGTKHSDALSLRGTCLFSIELETQHI